MKIKTKILLYLLISSSLLILTADGILYYFSSSHLKNEVFNHLATAAQSRARHVDTFLHLIKWRMIDFSSDGFITDCLSALNGNGDIDCTTTDLTNHLIKYKLPAIEELSEVFTMDLKGKIVASTVKEHIGSDKSRESFYIQGRKRPFLTDLYFSMAFQQNLLAVSAPVVREDELVGVIVGKIRPDILYEILLDRSGLGETGEIYLVNKNGYMISPSRFRKDVILRQEVHTINVTTCFDDYKYYGTSSGKINAHKEKPLIFKNYRDIPVLGAHAYIPQMKWALLAEINAEEALAPLQALLWIFVKVGIFSAFGIWLISDLLGRKISKPIVTLQRGTEIIMQGNLDYRLENQSQDEIGRLSRSFDEMTTKIKKFYTKLETKNSELEQFTFTVSHDLKAPLITINGFLGLLERDMTDQDTDRIKEDIKQINGAALKMKKLLDDLLELSRIGRIVNPTERMQLEDLVTEAIKLVAKQISNRGVKVEIISCKHIVHVDRIRLVEVLQNLIDNAAKYMGNQPNPRIEIGSKQDEMQTVCYVLDNGIGIEPEYHKKVFTLFERLDKKSKGTGLGLTIVKRIIEAHGGRVWIESKGGDTGSAFYFTLQRKGESFEG